MAASRLCSAAAIAAAFTSMSMSQNRAYADSRFRFPFYSSSPPSDSPANQSSNKSGSNPEPDEPKGSGFDYESLERGAKALREINSSPHSKQVKLSYLFTNRVFELKIGFLICGNGSLW